LAVASNSHCRAGRYQARAPDHDYGFGERFFDSLLVGRIKSCGESKRASAATFAGKRISLLRPSGMGFC
jgi:hypothetical protein